MPNVNCKICKMEFYIKPYHLSKGWGKYCSKECQSTGQRTGDYQYCAICLKKIWKMPKEIKHSFSKKFFCSKPCQAIWRNTHYIEEKHSRWVNGIRAYRQILQRSGAPQICTHCGISDVKVLIVHHKDHNRTNNTAKNLMWLCRNCHYLIHEGKTF